MTSEVAAFERAAVEIARTEGVDRGRAEERQKAAHRLVDSEMRARAVAGGLPASEIDDRLELLDRNKFLTDGDVDLDKVTNYIALLKSQSSSIRTGARRNGDAPRSVSAGAQRYIDRHSKKS